MFVSNTCAILLLLFKQRKKTQLVLTAFVTSNEKRESKRKPATKHVSIHPIISLKQCNDKKLNEMQFTVTTLSSRNSFCNESPCHETFFVTSPCHETFFVTSPCHEIKFLTSPCHQIVFFGNKSLSPNSCSNEKSISLNSSCNEKSLSRTSSCKN